MDKLVKVLTILIICTASIGLQSEKASAKDEKEVKLTLMNKKVNTNTSEAIVAIKNKKKSRIFISKVSIQRKDENWVEMKSQKLKYKIAAKKRQYADVNVKGIPSGNYRMVFHVKIGKKIKRRIMNFTVENQKNTEESTIGVSGNHKTEAETTGSIYEEEKPTMSGSDSEEPTTSEPATENPDEGQEPAPELPTSGMPGNITVNKPTQQVPMGTQTKGQPVRKMKSIKQILLNKDFRVSAKGKVEAVIFSETDYKTAYKTKIYLKIQRKTKKGFKTCKKYKQIKKSNIAYMNKTFQVKKQGKYRMYVKIISYTREGEKSVRSYRSKTVRYAK